MLDSVDLHAKPCIYNPPSCIHLHICSSLQQIKLFRRPRAMLLHNLLLSLLLTSSMARRPTCSDGASPTCTCSDGSLATKPPKPSPCSDGSLPTCEGSPLVCPNGEEWVPGKKCRRPKGPPACAETSLSPTCDDGSQPTFGRPGGRPGGRG